MKVRTHTTHAHSLIDKDTNTDTDTDTYIDNCTPTLPPTHILDTDADIDIDIDTIAHT